MKNFHPDPLYHRRRSSVPPHEPSNDQNQSINDQRQTEHDRSTSRRVGRQEEGRAIEPSIDSRLRDATQNSPTLADEIVRLKLNRDPRGRANERPTVTPTSTRLQINCIAQTRGHTPTHEDISFGKCRVFPLPFYERCSCLFLFPTLISVSGSAPDFPLSKTVNLRGYSSNRFSSRYGAQFGLNRNRLGYRAAMYCILRNMVILNVFKKCECVWMKNWVDRLVIFVE